MDTYAKIMVILANQREMILNRSNLYTIRKITNQEEKEGYPTDENCNAGMHVL